MKKFMKAALIALSVLVGTAGIAAVAAPHTVSAKKKKLAPKIDAAQFKKIVAALDKASSEAKKQQAALVIKLQNSQADLEQQIKDAVAQATAAQDTAAKDATTTDPATPAAVPAAPTTKTEAPTADPTAAADSTTPAATDPAAPADSTTPPAADPAAPAAPTTPPATDPAAPAAPATPAYEPAASFIDTLKKLAAKDESFKTLFPGKQLDKLSSLAANWLSYDQQLDKIAAANKKLEASYEEYVKTKKYAEALQVRTQQFELLKQVNKTYGSILTEEHLVSVVVDQAVNPKEEDKDKKDKKEKDKNHGKDKHDGKHHGHNDDGDHNEHDDHGDQDNQDNQDD